jgi:YVTN family beta-propeller protein
MRRIGIIGGLLCVAAVACSGGDPEVAPPSVPGTSMSPTPLPTPSIDAVATIPVGGEPIGITEGFGSVWVVNSEFLSGGQPAVSRIDSATNAVIATIPVGDVPLETTAGFGSIWVSNSESDSVSRIDPRANAVIATIDVCDAPEGFAIGAGSVWVVCENSGRVGIIDPASDRMSGTVRVGDEPRFATFAFGSVWVSNYAGSSVSRIDPASAKVIATVAIDFGGQILATLDGTVWVSSTDYDTVQRIDPATDKVVGTIDTESHPDGMLAVDGSAPVARTSPSINDRRSRERIECAERFTATLRPPPARRIASVVTHRSISPMRPYFSATGRKLGPEQADHRRRQGGVIGRSAGHGIDLAVQVLVTDGALFFKSHVLLVRVMKAPDRAGHQVEV